MNHEPVNTERPQFLVVKRLTDDIGVALQFKMLFRCCMCKKEVTPDKVAIGTRHIYFTHCGVQQEVGVIT